MSLSSPISDTRTWLQVRSAASGKHSARVEFLFCPDYIRDLWERRPDVAGTERSPSRFGLPVQETLLLDDVILIDGASGFIRAWLIPASREGYCHLRVEMVAPRRSSRNAYIRLQWDDKHYAGTLRAGEMLFEDISPPDYSRFPNNLPSSRLRLTFEFEAHGKNGSH